MEIYFLRHGLTGERSEWKGDAAARPLTDAGVKNVRGFRSA